MEAERKDLFVGLGLGLGAVRPRDVSSFTVAQSNSRARRDKHHSRMVIEKQIKQCLPGPG